FFDHAPGVVPINWLAPPLLLDTDVAWRPCVGPSHSGTPTDSALYVNSDRADMVVNRRPWLAVIGWARTDASLDLTRIHTATMNLPAFGGLSYNPFTPDPLIEVLAAPGGTEEYNPKLAMGQGREEDLQPNTAWPR